jgi:hypothetical protein
MPPVRRPKGKKAQAVDPETRKPIDEPLLAEVLEITRGAYNAEKLQAAAKS